MRQVAFGVYQYTDSRVHQLDPRTKLAGTLLYIITLFFPMNPAGLALSILFLVWVISASKVRFTSAFRGVKAIWPILIFTVLANLFFTRGHVVWTAGPFSMTEEGLRLSFYLLMRLVLLVAGSSILMLTTTPGEIAAGLEKSFHFLTKAHVPVHEYAMMMSIALRFIPILSEEFQRIRDAQMSRGADFEEGNILARARKTLPILVPLFVSAIRRAGQLANAMDARCYHGGEGRTKLHPLNYGKKDGAAYLILLGYLILMMLCAII